MSSDPPCLVRRLWLLTIPWQTAAGLSEWPGELEGHGPVPADQARALAFGALGSDTIWERLLTDPVSGVAQHVDPRRYRPPRALARFVRARDPVTHRAPGPASGAR